MKIEFIEKIRSARRFYRFLGQVADYIDLYFKKDRKEFFVSGMADCELKYKIEGFLKDMKNQVIKNEGKFVTFYCVEWYYHRTIGCRNPIEFLDRVKKKNFSFESFSGVWKENGLPGKPWDFHGNLREANATFSFRIWDEQLMGML